MISAANHSMRSRNCSGEAVRPSGTLVPVAPAVAQARRAPDRHLGVAADPEGRVGLLDRLRLEFHALELEELALEARVFLGPELDHNAQVFVGAGAALGEGHLQDLELALHV